MTDTPIIDAAIRAGCESVGRIGCQYPDCEPNKSFTCKPAEIARRALRAANPWEPPAEEIEAMSHAIRGWNSRGFALAAYRARPIMRELYDSDGALR